MSLGAQSSVERVAEAHAALTASGRVADYDKTIDAYNALVRHLVGSTEAAPAAAKRPATAVSLGFHTEADVEGWIERRLRLENQVIDQYRQL